MMPPMLLDFGIPCEGDPKKRRCGNGLMGKVRWGWCLGEFGAFRKSNLVGVLFFKCKGPWDEGRPFQQKSFTKIRTYLFPVDK